MFNIKTALNPGWKRALKGEFEQPYIKQLERFLDDEYSAHKTIYPPRSELFSAFNSTPPEKVRVVIIGQDPYHAKAKPTGSVSPFAPVFASPPLSGTSSRSYTLISASVRQSMATSSPGRTREYFFSTPLFLLRRELPVHTRRGGGRVSPTRDPAHE